MKLLTSIADHICCNVSWLQHSVERVKTDISAKNLQRGGSKFRQNIGNFYPFGLFLYLEDSTNRLKCFGKKTVPLMQ